MSKTNQQTVAEQTTATTDEVLQQTVVALTEENEKLIAELEQLKEENGKLTKTVARLQSSADKSDTYLGQLVAMKSDFESYKRRMRLDTEQAKTQGVQSVALKLISICDVFDLSKQHLADETSAKAFQMVHNQFLQVLAEIGVQEIDVLGKEFDCMTMNALSKLDRGGENTDKVVEVYKKGYKMGDKILRYAEVIVGA